MRVLIAAGGTAGHINPALAIAGALKKRHPDAEIHFAGRQKGMEYGLVSKAGYAFHPIEVNGIQRRLTPKNIARNLVALWHLALSGPRADAILREAARIAAEGVDEDYFRRIRKASFGANLRGLNSFENIAVTLTEGYFHGYDPLRFPEVFESITPEDVAAFLKTNVTAERMVLSRIVPKQ